ncbi:MAG: hypothetical protein Q8Q59_16370 [Luteolibacter sp.]|nr:hypothetical protein [Luteolibacter sp.]
MKSLRLPQHSGDAIHCRGGFFRTPCHGAHDAAAAGAVPEKILADIRCALTGQELADIEITHHALHAVTVLNRGAHSCGKGRGDEFRTAAAPFALGLVLGHLHGDGRQVENLALFHAGDGFFAQATAAMGAVSQRGGMGDAGGGALLEGLAGVAWLTAGLAAGVFAPQGFAFALSEEWA